ncbi:hypothetical protein Zmor_022542 [Zophobas morio]|uniref:PRKR-interacting protein 1 n=1 Tax=Zophobas morio TaxID=2755281 RepID=A0AA38M644_9CUCU|nr:hypothetical protein Zmor_022542 [Zophobas morio]
MGDRDSSPDMEIERPARPIIIRNTTDLQRLKLEKLMKNPEKPVVIPEKPKERGVPVVPDFVRNVMGSSAGAGSGEFHVYRHLRRKEYARQKYMKEKGERERLDNEYHSKLEENKNKAEARTAKKRQKRLKRKQNQKGKKAKNTAQSESTSSSSDSEEDNDKIEDENKAPECGEEKQGGEEEVEIKSKKADSSEGQQREEKDEGGEKQDENSD